MINRMRGVEVFTEDPRPEDPGPVRVRVYILNGQPGPVGSQSITSGPGSFNFVCNNRVDRRTPHPPEISVSQHA